MNAFAEKDKSLPVFLRERGIKGTLRVTNADGRRIEKVKLVLRGFFVNMIGHGCAELYQPHKLKMEQRVRLLFLVGQ